MPEVITKVSSKTKITIGVAALVALSGLGALAYSFAVPQSQQQAKPIKSTVISVLPDVAVTNVNQKTVLGSGANEGEITGVYFISYINNSDTASPAIELALWVEGEKVKTIGPYTTMSFFEKVKSVTINSLKPHESQSINLQQVFGAKAGEITKVGDIANVISSMIKIDSTNILTEINEENNTWWMGGQVAMMKKPAYDFGLRNVIFGKSADFPNLKSGQVVVQVDAINYGDKSDVPSFAKIKVWGKADITTPEFTELLAEGGVLLENHRQKTIKLVIKSDFPYLKFSIEQDSKVKDVWSKNNITYYPSF